MLGLGLGVDKIRPVSGGLLDLYPATAAYSLRALSSSTTNVVKVREDGLNQEQDFTAKEITDGTLASFCGANNGFVVTWYDQAGSNDATQATAGEQPKIYDSSTGVVLENGKPTIDFDGVDDLFQSSRLITTNTWSMFAVIKKDDLLGGETLLGQHTGGSLVNRVNFMQFTDDQYQIFFNNGTSHFNAHSTVMTTNQTLLGSLASGDNYSLAINGDLEQVITGQSLIPLNASFNIGALGDSNNPHNGKIQEIVVYTSDQSTNRTAIEDLINSHYNIYS